jgi:uncharacterized protein (TIGR03382 family)
MLPSSFLRPAALVASVLGLALAACSDGGQHSPGEDIGTTTSGINPISGCDYSFARPAPSSLVSMGYQFAARYLSGDPSSGKDITASEASGLTGAGLDIVLVWETSGTDATSGYNQGVSDATAAKSEAATVGQPTTRPIYFAVDFDADSSDASSINAYFQGVASVIGLSRTGIYGGYYIVNELFNEGLVTFGWQTYAWSDGSWDSRAQLRQTQNGVDDDQLDADEGMVADFGQYGPNAPSGTADYAAQFVSQSFPLASSALAMVEGQTIASYIELKNVGTKSWDSNTRIGTTEPRDRDSVFADSSWVSPNRLAQVSGTVAPGSTYKFTFNFHAPNKTGTYLEYFGVVEDGVAWFGDPGQGGPPDNDLEAQIVVTQAEYAATFDSQTYPLAPTAYTMHVGETAQGSITLTNTGTKPWVAGTTKLAPIPRDTASSFATDDWLSTTRVSTVAADVQPGDKGTFSLPLKATAVGDFEVELGLVEEAVTWFADAPLGGGPADGFLKVHVTVVAEGASLDAGTASTGGDAGGSGTASSSGKPPIGKTIDGGNGLGQTTGAGGRGSENDAPDAGGDAAGDADVGAPGTSGGCNAGGGDASGLAAFGLVGLVALLRRRRVHA